MIRKNKEYLEKLVKGVFEERFEKIFEKIFEK